MTDFTLIVADGSEWLAEVDTYETAEIVGRFNDVSTWTVTLPTKSHAAQLLLAASQPRLVVTSHPANVFRSGPAVAFERENTWEGDLLTVSGVDDLIWLRRRLAHPQPGTPNPPYSTTAYDVRSGSASQVIAQYVDVNAGPGAVAARRVQDLTVPVPAAMGPTVTKSARYQNLLDLVSRMANRAHLGIEVRDLEFTVFQPSGPAAVFSVELGTLAGWFSVVEVPTATFVYVAGGGRGTARVIREYVDIDSAATWGRLETFDDRRDTTVTAELDEAGAEVLADLIPTTELSLQALDTPAQGFLTDWQLGDKATVTIDDQVITDTIRSVTITLEANVPPTVVPVIGAAVKLDTFRRLDDHARRIRQLERTEPESGGGDHADSDHADAFSALAHTHGPGGGSTAWADITGKPSTFPPDEHDPTHDDRFALIVHTHAAHADSDHDDRFSLLAHAHAAHADSDHDDRFSLLAHAHDWATITGKPATFAPTEHDTDHSDVFSPLAHTHAAHADSDHDDRFSLLAHAHDWATITGKPATFTPTPQALDWLTDVATGGQTAGHVLTYNGSNWVPNAPVSADWATITGKPATFPPTPEMLYLAGLADVNTDGASDGKVLTYDSTAPAGWKAEPSHGVPAGGGAGQGLIKATASDYDTQWADVGGAVGIPPGGVEGQALVKTSDTDYAVDWELASTAWTSVTGKPSTFPPDEHDTAHDDRFSQLAHTHTAPTWTQVTGKPTVFPPDEHDTAHDDRFSLLAHTHAAHADSDHDDRFALIEHDTAHDDRFSLLAHTHTGPVEVAYAQVTADVTSSATTTAGSTLVVAAPAVTYTAVPYEIEFFSGHVSAPNAVGGQTIIGLYDGAAGSPTGRLAQVRTPTATTNQGWPVTATRRITPSAGSHTWQIRVYVSTGSGTVGAGAGTGDLPPPAYIKITRL